MEKIVFIPFEGYENRLKEIFQAVDIKFSILDEEYRQVTQPAKCRDYLGDVLWSKEYDDEVSIYGIEYNYADTPFYEEEFRLTLKFPNNKTQENFIKNLPFLHSKEEIAGVTKTEVYETQEKDTLLVVGDKMWLSCVWKISFFTFYLKLLASEDPSKPEKGVEKDYIKTLNKDPNTEEFLLSQINTDYKVTIYDELDENHNDSGFLSVITHTSSPVHKEVYAHAVH